MLRSKTASLHTHSSLQNFQQLTAGTWQLCEIWEIHAAPTPTGASVGTGNSGNQVCIQPSLQDHHKAEMLLYNSRSCWERRAFTGHRGGGRLRGLCSAPYSPAQSAGWPWKRKVFLRERTNNFAKICWTTEGWHLQPQPSILREF